MGADAFPEIIREALANIIWSEGAPALNWLLPEVRHLLVRTSFARPTVFLRQFLQQN
jgi:hypothetical protein